jgi:DNA-binding NarL/FixJ family response regulator
MDKPIRVLLVDDQPLYLAALEHVLGSEWRQIECVAFGDGAQALASLAREHFDLTLMNWETLGSVELDEALALAASKRILFTTASESFDIARRAMAAGVRGVLVKSAAPRTLSGAVALVLSGHVCYPEHVLAALSSGENARPEVIPNPRELEILRCLERGDSNKLIARELGISVATVKFHVQGILRTTRARNRVEAVMNARRLGLLTAVGKRFG